MRKTLFTLAAMTVAVGAWAAPVTELTDVTPAYYKFYQDSPQDLDSILRADVHLPGPSNFGNINWITDNSNGNGNDYFTAHQLANGNVLFGAFVHNNSKWDAFKEAYSLYDFGGALGKAMILNGKDSKLNETIQEAYRLDEAPEIPAYNAAFGANFNIFHLLDFNTMNQYVLDVNPGLTADALLTNAGTDAINPIRVRVRVELNAYNNDMTANYNIVNAIYFQNQANDVFGSETEAVPVSYFADENGNWNPNKWLAKEFEFNYTGNPGAVKYVGTATASGFDTGALLVRSIEVYVVPQEEAYPNLDKKDFSAYYNYDIDYSETTPPVEWEITDNIKDLATGDTLEAVAVVTAQCARGVILTDNAGSILYYNTAIDLTQYPVGTIVSVAGEVSAYNHGLQLSNNATLEVVGTTDEVYTLNPTLYTAEMVDEACAATENFLATLVSIEGQLSVSGNYYNVIINGATAQGSLYYATDEVKSQLENGKNYKLTGYFMAVSGSSPKYFNIIITGIEEIEVPVEPEKWCAYFTNPLEWEEVYVWAWNTDQNFTGGNWPGIPAYYIEEDDLWYIEGEAVGSPEYIIFNNHGQGEQTGDLLFVNGATYDMDGTIVEITSNIQNLEAGETLEATAIVTAQSGRGLILTDNAGSIFYYNNNVDLDTYSIGTVVDVKGAVSLYGTGFQLSNTAEISVVGFKPYDYPEPVVYTAEMIDNAVNATPEVAEYVSIEGKLSISGNYYNIGIEGATIQGSLYTPTEEILSQLENEESYTFKGYFTGVTSGKYFYMVLTDVINVNPPAPSCPDQLYMIGDLLGYTWDSTKGLEMTKVSEGVFQATDVEMQESMEVYFAFTSELGSWDVVNANRVSPESNTEFIVGEDNSFVIGRNTSWEIAGGVYTFTVDFNKMIVTAEGEAYEFTEDKNIYLVGSMTNWDFLPEYALTPDENGKIYTGEFEIATPQEGSNLAFKFSNINWSGKYNLGLPEVGEYEIFSDEPLDLQLVNGNSGNIIVTNWAEGTLMISLDIETLQVVISGPDQKTNAVNRLNVDNDEEVIYNIQGIRVNRDQLIKGLYIINGKKVMVK